MFILGDTFYTYSELHNSSTHSRASTHMKNALEIAAKMQCKLDIISSMLTGIPHDSLVGLCESYFSAIPAGSAAANQKPNYTGGTFLRTVQSVILFPQDSTKCCIRD